MVPTYPEDSSRALKVSRSTSRLVGSPKIGPRLRSRVFARDVCAGRFGWNLHGITPRGALCDTVQVASAGTSVRACLSSMYPR
eukprot:scaffold22520_cov66-Phaeocystis_antarctica.AAC.4